jgi:CheY-like chemotaxis protein
MPATPPPSQRYGVALEGFSAFERSALASFFRLAAQRAPAYDQVADSAEGDFIIADADHPGALDRVQSAGRTADTVFVGSHAPPGAMAWLPRPIEPLHIMRELDSLVEQRLSGASIFAESMFLPAVDLLLGQMDLPALEAQASAAPAATGGMALVVEDSAIARKFLQQRLQRLGYRVHLARHGEQALEMLAVQRFDVVCIDITLGPAGSIDGLQVCQAVHQAAAESNTAAPGVIIVTGSKVAADRVRGSLAGCDAYLVKPVSTADLVQALRVADPAFNTGFSTLEA